MLAENEILNQRYRITETPSGDEHAPGNGAMSFVYRGVDLQLERPVVIKVPRRDKDPAFKLFKREREALLKLHGHPNIMELYDAGSYSLNGLDFPFLVFQSLDGDLRPITEVATSAQRIDYVLAAIIGACRGLAFAHSLKLVHRDIKPDNLFWARGGTAKVGDFGLAKDTRGTQTIVGNGAHWHGTLLYMSPEKLRDDPTADEFLSDIYSMGVTLYYLLAKRHPHTGNRQELLASIDRGHIVPLTVVDPDIGRPLSDIVLRALDREPSRRPKSFDELADTLESELAARRGLRLPTQAVIERPSALREVKSCLVAEIRQVIQSLVYDANTPLVPYAQEHPDWYATVYMRPTNGSNADHLADILQPIYMAHLERSQVAHTSDWDAQPELRRKGIDIRKCCSGFPIRYYTEVAEWDAKRWRNKEKPSMGYIDVWTGPYDRVNLIILRRVHEARFGTRASHDNPIRQYYATDHSSDGTNAVGWYFRNERGEEHKMSSEIQTEILVPIYVYDPTQIRWSGDRMRNRILGVANFEWVQELNEERIEGIGNGLIDAIHKGSIFPITYFMCKVLEVITRP